LLLQPNAPKDRLGSNLMSIYDSEKFPNFASHNGYESVANNH